MPNTAPEQPIHVVAGVIVRGTRVFVTRRPPGTHLGGKWEFPGGKCAAHEDAPMALVRELGEETGILVQRAEPWMRIRHRYPEKDVLLDVWRVAEFRGTPHGREGQQADWRDVATLQASEFPAADRLIIRRLQLPPLYAISAAQQLGSTLWLRRLATALAAGLRLVQLREPQMPPDQFAALAREAIALCHRFGARLLINGPSELARALGADGVHLTSTRLRACAARPLPEDMLVGASCHNEAELQQAEQIGVDLTVIGAVKETSTHPRAMPLGWDRFQQLCGLSNVPAYALGGLRPEDLATARSHGAQGIAMISAIWLTGGPAGVVSRCASDV